MDGLWQIAEMWIWGFIIFWMFKVIETINLKLNDDVNSLQLKPI